MPASWHRGANDAFNGIELDRQTDRQTGRKKDKKTRRTDKWQLKFLNFLIEMIGCY